MPTQTAEESRIDVIGQNGNDGLHYDAPSFEESASFDPPNGFAAVGPVCKGHNCGSTDPRFHSAECHLQHEMAAKPQGYDSLYLVLREAFDHASVGKGSDRHAQGQPFDQQPMQKLIELYGLGFALGQAGKKMQESQRMTPSAAKHELLGAINYIAGAIIHLEKRNG
jgi:hypothetical protein